MQKLARTDRKFVALGLSLAAAMSLLAAGCGNRQDELPKSSASTTVGTAVDDTVVTTKVKSALFADPDIKSFDLKVEARKGEVQLSGYVDSQAQIDEALAIAGKVNGVTRVGNEMTIKQ